MTEHIRNLLNAAQMAAEDMEDMKPGDVVDHAPDTTELRAAIQDVLDDEQRPDETEKETHA